MATKTFEELKQLAIQIRDEKTNKQNTATRIGTQMLEHLNKLEQDYYDKTATDEELKQRDEKLTELEWELHDIYNSLNYNFNIDGWLAIENGNIVTNEAVPNAKSTDFIPCKEGDIFYIKSLCPNVYPVWFYNKTGSTNLEMHLDMNYEGVFTVPPGYAITQLRACTLQYSNDVVILKLSSLFSYIKNKENLKFKNLYSQDNDGFLTYKNQTGVLADSYYSNKIPVVGIKKLIYRGYTIAEVCPIIFFDLAERILSYIPVGYEGVIDIPKDAATMVINGLEVSSHETYCYVIDSVEAVIFNNLKNINKNHVEEYFQVEVSVTNKYSLSSTTTSDNYILTEKYKDWCYYYQPDKTDNTPYKLLIVCHGAGDWITSNYNSRMKIPDLAKALGYAILECNYFPIEYFKKIIEKDIAITDVEPFGSWMIAEEVEKAFDYISNKYNIDKNAIFLAGWSQGGIAAEQIAEMTNIPIRAEVIDCPCISFRFHQTARAESDENRAKMAQALYGFTSIGNYTNEKCYYLDPCTRGCTEELCAEKTSRDEISEEYARRITAKKYRKNIPLLILIGNRDTDCWWPVNIAYAKAIQNAGGNSRFILYEGIGHCTTQLCKKIGTINNVGVNSALQETFEWFENHGGIVVPELDS